MTTTTSTDLDYDQALEVFLATDASYDGGLSNHGPMAAEALVSMGTEEYLGAFVATYRQRLDAPRWDVEPAPEEWQPWLRQRLPALIGETATLAGHGLLRVAHAVRGIERVTAGPPATRLRELGAAVAYWERGGTGIAAPPALDGTRSAADWVADFRGPALDQRSTGSLTATLRRAAETPEFTARVASLAPAPDPAATLDVLAAAAADAVRRNEGRAAFALLHGTTVSAIARVLLPHLEPGDARRLEASVASFVAAAVMGFDEAPPEAAGPDETPLPTLAELATSAAASLDDHTIKFADACLGVAARTGTVGPLRALHRQITTPYGVTS